MGANNTPKGRKSRIRDGVIFALLMALGFVYLWSKVNRDEPVKFSERALPEAARLAMEASNADLAKADRDSLAKAQTEYWNVLQLAPDYPPARARAALCFAILAHLDQADDVRMKPARAAADAVLDQFPDDKDALLAKAWTLPASEGDQIRTLANKVLKQDRYNVFALYLLSEVAAQAGKHKLALRDAETLALQDPQAIWLRAPRCKQAIAVGHREIAVPACEWAFGKMPDTTEGVQLLAQAKALTQ